MTSLEREYLDRMGRGFEEKANVAKERLKHLAIPDEFGQIDMFIFSMEICAELIHQIRSDLEKIEKAGELSDEQATSEVFTTKQTMEESSVPS